MNTFTAQDMKDYADYVIKARRMLVEPTLSYWYAQRNKPAKKVIDLSVLIESEVLCVFFDPSTPSSATGKLKKIRGSDAYVSNNRDSSGMPVSSRACKPLMNHIHAWNGGNCPLPEGFRVDVIFRDGSKGFNMTTCTLRWTSDGDTLDIIQFEVLGLADDYVMPWEVSYE